VSQGTVDLLEMVVGKIVDPLRFVRPVFSLPHYGSLDAGGKA
jgi:hypothetical protein